MTTWETAGQRIETALACAAFDPRLRGVLCYDLDPALLPSLAAWLADLTAGRGTPYELVVAGAGTTEDDLWTRVRPVPGLLAGREPGPLADLPDRVPAVVIVPDLAEISLAAARAAVTVLGSETAYLERDGVHAVWSPKVPWIAACARQDMGKVSTHLLDRFALRVDARGVEAPPSAGPAPWLRAAARPTALPRFTPEAVERVVERTGRAPGARRDLALARLARALAAMRTASQVTASDVDEAAELIGLPTPKPDDDEHATTVPDGRLARRRPTGDGRRRDESAQAGAVEQAVVEVPAARPLTAAAALLTMAATPYPEDLPGLDSEPSSLRTSWVRRSAATSQRGVPVGHVRAHDLSDLALVATLLEAGRFQLVRCPGHFDGPPHPPHLQPSDLRRYRRAEVPGRLFTLLLDHTCRKDWDWYPALAPYLHWCYTERAAVCVIEVGAEGHELTARRVTGRNLLDPRVVAALDRRPGRSTPLAHGLVLAVDALRRYLQRDRAAVDEALFIVVTDGRANVPIHNSLTGETPQAVAREGVDDALAVAREIRMMRKVESFIMHPRPYAGEGLVLELADALGAAVVPGRDHVEGTGAVTGDG
ncbi:hypothetical protein [Nonomuraea fuscirosea]|uniref:hypothetical protein n=1 Tax=Nonomuraea fuscirosea TaxID=1291556 RepID=UPI0033F362C6